MNNAKMWLVVKPSTGIPLLLGGVAVASFAVHLSVLSFAGWYGDYANGRDMGAEAAALSNDAAPAMASYTVGTSTAALISH